MVKIADVFGQDGPETYKTDGVSGCSMKLENTADIENPSPSWIKEIFNFAKLEIEMIEGFAI